MEFKKYTRTIQVNGNAVEAEVVVKVNEDDVELLLDQDFENDSKRAEYTSKVQCGDVFCGSIVVEASAEGITGFDSLGGCELTPNNMFNSAPFNKSVEGYLVDHGMEQIAIEDLIKSMESEHGRLISEARLSEAAAAMFKKYTKGDAK